MLRYGAFIKPINLAFIRHLLGFMRLGPLGGFPYKVKNMTSIYELIFISWLISGRCHEISIKRLDFRWQERTSLVTLPKGKIKAN